jgi:hypothetical protein
MFQPEEPSMSDAATDHLKMTAKPFNIKEVVRRSISKCPLTGAI